MEAGENSVLVRKQAQEGLLSIPAEPPSGKGILNGPELSIASLVSTLTSAVSNQHAMSLAKLHHELEAMEKERKRFQKAVTDALLNLEGTLGTLRETTTKLETRTSKVEQRMREEEDRGSARSKVLAFLLSREKELRKKCAVLDKMFLKKSAWLEGKVHRWKNP
ncbi:coiled-coil domain-containing protein 182 [Anolis carolinensis]|uniref:coiled-coil domain-containing protein 182 n=1 Tax=Anolis carolinensis TaxID=28377 RepID=UPI000462C30A|nr:PREDICTED: coiled-coil domain-containing protein 182 [Anolis carolinensis]|eukprot:XP_008118480.1 PREDICTED: coiled-coil domain-containing protein 182 [Anolis carolinensis]